jgi:hypothetical protein
VNAVRCVSRGPRGRPCATAAVALLSLAACAGAGPGQATAQGAARAPDATSGSGWRPRIDPFAVRDTAGAPYDFPCLGGFNVPRPQLVDLDGDGDLDLVVQERNDELLYFERRDGAYALAPALGPDVPVGEWFRFVDVDADGDPDLLSEQPFSYVRLYRNEGAAGYRLVADTIRDARGGAIFSDRQNIPNAADIDCDGRLDLFIGRLAGTITRYEATGAVGATVAPFRHVEDRFQGIEIIAEFGNPLYRPPADTAPTTGPSMHGANTMALADVDGDGDIDLFWGDFFEPGLLLMENTGTCARPDMSGGPVAFPSHDPVLTSGYNAPTFGDADGDGDPDLVMGVLGGAYDANRSAADNLYYFAQGDGRFELVTTRLISQLDVGAESVPVLVDWEGDGDLDLLLANKVDPTEVGTSRIYLFENETGPQGPSYVARGPIAVQGAYHNAPALGDLDADGDLDMVLGTWRPDVAVLWNRGSRSEPRYEAAGAPLVTLTRGANAVPTLGDLDGAQLLSYFRYAGCVERDTVVVHQRAAKRLLQAFADFQHTVQHLWPPGNARHIEQQGDTGSFQVPDLFWNERGGFMVVEGEQRLPLIIAIVEHTFGFEFETGRLGKPANLSAGKKGFPVRNDIDSNRHVDVSAEIIKFARRIERGIDIRQSRNSCGFAGAIPDEIAKCNKLCRLHHPAPIYQLQGQAQRCILTVAGPIQLFPVPRLGIEAGAPHRLADR